MKNKVWITSLSVIIVIGLVAGAVVLKNIKEPESRYIVVGTTVFEDLGAVLEDGTLKPELVKKLGTNIAKGCLVICDNFLHRYVPNNVVDGDPKTYWEGSPNFYPNEIAVDLKKIATIKNLGIRLNPSNQWKARTQTFSIMVSDDKTIWKEIKPSAEYKFDPNKGNAIIIPLDSVKARYVKLIFTANSAANAGQMAEFEVYE